MYTQTYILDDGMEMRRNLKMYWRTKEIDIKDFFLLIQNIILAALRKKSIV